MNINKIVHQFLVTLPNLKGKKIAVGYSAGADSTALLHVLEQKSKHFNFHLEAVFFSHLGSPINEGEDKNLALAREFCQSLNIPLVEVELNLVKKAKKSWEQLGRNGRLDFYKNANYDYAFLGHHKDDQNETTMTQIFRGGGKGASGMKARDGIYCRPMLDIPKSAIYDYLKEKQIQWIEDPTNVNSDFTRNFWRNIGLPAIEKHYPNYSDLLDNFREKNNNFNQIAFDMAKVDGLDNFLAGQSINVKNLPAYRIQNLLSQSFQFIGNSAETKRIDTFLSNGTKKNPSQMELGDFSISYDGRTLALSNMEQRQQFKLRA
jgi:tRNA(Ile)-lysidine synthetase-like protein